MDLILSSVGKPIIKFRGSIASKEPNVPINTPTTHVEIPKTKRLIRVNFRELSFSEIF